MALFGLAPYSTGAPKIGYFPARRQGKLLNSGVRQGLREFSTELNAVQHVVFM